jgi:aminocarboxymuconate-semialdehyde decarboxylase
MVSRFCAGQCWHGYTSILIAEYLKEETPVLIDVHSHIAPLTLPACPGAEEAARWPCMQCQSATQATILMGSKPFRELDDRSWNASRRIADMDREGVDIQVLSPMPELLSYWMGVDAGALLCDHVNGAIAEIISKAPRRFRGLGATPMQDPARAAAYLTRVRDEFSLSGIEIGSNINGLMLGDSRFDPVYEAAEALGLAIFVHALHPVATRGLDAPVPFTGFVGFPIDVAMAGASLIMGGTLDRFPKLRIALSHGGGALASILGRLELGWTTTKGFGGKAARNPRALASTMFYDSNVYDGVYLSHLSKILPGRVFAGTDYPYAIMQKDPAAFIAAGIADADERASVRNGAASAFLGEDFG